MRYSFIVIPIIVALLSTGCATKLLGPQAYLPEPRPLGREMSIGSTESTMLDQSIEMTESELTLRQALTQALLHNPELAAFSWEIRIQEAEAMQEGLLTNPELGAELENFGGSGEFSGNNVSESTVALSQLIRLGGKRKKSKAAATLETELAGWDFEAKRLDVLTSTGRAFFVVLAAQTQVNQADEMAALSQRFFNTVKERVKAGESSPVEQTRAQVTLSESRIVQDQSRSALAAARMELAAFWGDESAVFDHVIGTLEKIDPVPMQSQLTAFLNQNPDIARWETEEKLRDAELSLERANAIPDLTLSAGFRKFKETSDNAFVVGFSIPISIFDRNQGGIAAARAAQGKAVEERRAARIQVQSNLGTSYQALNAAFLATQKLQKKILPAAEQAFEAIDIGYRAGKFSFLEVLDAQKTLFEVKGQYIEELAAYHLAKTEVERLIGAPLETIIRQNSEEK